MKKICFAFLTMNLLFACKEFSNEKSIIKNKVLQIEKTIEAEATDSVPPEIQFDIDKHIIKYDRLKQKIAFKRGEIANKNTINNDEKQRLAERYVSAILIDSVFEYWKGTEWDFNGYTETPRKGVVACGYYVSTTLRDIGLRINRYKVAQKGAADIIKELCDRNSIKTLNGYINTKKHLQHLENYEIVIVGLDYHVGYVFKKNDKLYFAHSNYIDLKGVMKERLDDSDAFKNSEYFVVGKLTKSPGFLTKWLNDN